MSPANRDIETIVTSTEAQALHLEQSLIKRHRPPFNIRLRDDKSFPYIAVTVEDEYPRVMFTRERHRRGVVYFGPYANAKKVRETLDVLNRAFRFRPCEGPRPGVTPGSRASTSTSTVASRRASTRSRRRSTGKIIDGVIEFLSGDTQTIDRQLQAEMGPPRRRSGSRTPRATATGCSPFATWQSARLRRRAAPTRST